MQNIGESAMELKPSEQKQIKIDCIDKRIQSLDRAIKANRSAIIQEVYMAQVKVLEDWKAQIKAEPEAKK